jgi:hypothetical protein
VTAGLQRPCASRVRLEDRGSNTYRAYHTSFRSCHQEKSDHASLVSTRTRTKSRPSESTNSITIDEY